VHSRVGPLGSEIGEIAPFLHLVERLLQAMRDLRLAAELVFSKWDQIFKDPMMTEAAIERVGHHAVGTWRDRAS
jgi:hypothetical protein